MISDKTVIHRPTTKLVTAFLCMATVMVCLWYDQAVSRFETSKDMAWFQILHIILGVCYLFYLTFKSPFQVIYGSVFAAIGFLILAILFGVGEPTSLSSVSMSLVLVLGCFTAAYLFIFDRDIASYRKWLRVHLDQKCRLDPKVDNLFDDPINPT
jgi:hypothetical protein